MADMDRARAGTLSRDIEDALSALDGDLPAPSDEEVDDAIATVRKAVGVLRDPALAAAIIKRHGKQPKKDDES